MSRNSGHFCFGVLPGLPGQKRKNKNERHRSAETFIGL
jgi:hypothetical protein